MRTRVRWILPLLVAAAAVTAASTSRAARTDTSTATPIKHVVVIFQENVSFDHYFGTYPNATNTDGRPFTAAPGTPSVDGLTPALLTSNPNANDPFRLDSSANGPGSNGNGQLTCDQDHGYTDEQKAFDNGAMDEFVQSVGTAHGNDPAGTAPCQAATVMGYYDGNVATALWNYAQHDAMSDNSYGTTFGPSAPGAINLAAGDTGRVDTSVGLTPPASNGNLAADGLGGYSLISDAQPYWDDCSLSATAVALKGTNIGDELNAAGLSWGWFQGGFRPTTTFASAAPGQSTATFTPREFAGLTPPAHASNQGLCDAVHPVGVAFGATLASASWGYKDDYIPHHEPFQYYASTANPHHLAPASLSAIGTDTEHYVGATPQFDTANHNYDTSDFDALVAAINGGTLPASALPAVTFLKAPGYQDGHAAYSDPADEQAFVVREIDALEKTPDWSSTAVFINYDDSDGWYDHQLGAIVNPSHTVADVAVCTGATGTPLAGEQGRCGLGPRLPMIVVSPWAKTNYVDHDLSDQSSIINFIEYNWHLPAIPESFDQALAATDAQEGVPFDLAGMFDFTHMSSAPQFQLDPQTGQIDLRNATIHGESLKGADLEGAELMNADLHGANLIGADLANANLTGATLQGANTNKVIWSNTVCPDGSNSSSDGGTCQGHL
jgi:phospholipase C